MKHIGIKQARQQLPALIDQVEAGAGVIITRQGKAVARLIAVSKTPKPLPSLAEFRRGLDQRGDIFDANIARRARCSMKALL